MKRVKRGRNEACWCGSGKKYKRCHMGADTRLGGRRGRVGRSRSRKRSRAALVLDAAGQDGMRAAGRFNGQLMDALRPRVEAGARLDAIDDFVREYTLDHGHVPACIGYKGYPKALCASVNDVVCHGIPDGYELREGDIVNIDITSIVDGWHGDQSETFLIGEVSDQARALVQCAFDCLYEGIAAIRPNGRVIDIGHAIQRMGHARGFSVVEAFQGHGIGREFHQDPGVPHYPEPSSGDFIIQPGMCFTIEPMINAGRKECTIDAQDGWTARTVDGSLSAQFEHTILMTAEGPEILTGTAQGPQPGYTF